MTRRNIFTVLLSLLASPTFAQCIDGICVGPAEYPLGVPGPTYAFPRTAPRAPIATNPTLPRNLAASTVRIINQQGPTRSLGSGAIVASGGRAALVVTCGHLFREGVGRVIVVTQGNRAVDARVLDVELGWDIAVLSIPAVELPALPVASSPPTIGAGLTYGGFGPHGRLAFGAGRLVSFVRMQHTPTADTLQLTGAARQGDSGGPIVSTRGELVGLIVGTDGHVVIGPSCRPIARFLARFRSLVGPAGHPLGAAGTKLEPSPQGRPESSKQDGIDPPNESEQPAHNEEKHNESDRPADEAPARSPAAPRAARVPDAPRGYPAGPTIFSLLLPVILAALGISVPPTTVFVALRVARCLARRSLRRRKRTRRNNSQKTNDKQIVNDQGPTTCSRPSVELDRRLNDDYARELASVFAYGGQSPLQDATLGREFSREIDRAAQSSDAKMADWARDVRDRVLRRFHRIHGWQPSPAEPAE